MARQRSHSIEFKRQVAQEFIAGESLYALSKRHDISRQLIRVWVEKYEAGALDEDAQAADLLQEYEAKIAALERMVGRQALEIEFLRGALKNAPRMETPRDAKAQAQGQRGKECGGTTAGTKVPRVQLHDWSGHQAQDRAEISGTVQAANPGDHAKGQGR